MRILLPLLVLLASCGASHKLKTSVKKTVDSVVTAHRDTATVSQESTSTDDLNVKGLDIILNYGTTKPAEKVDTGEVLPKGYNVDDRDYIYEVPKSQSKTYSEKIDKIIRNAIAAAGKAGEIQSVSIHIDDLSSSSKTSNKKDSSAGHSDTKADVKKTEATTTKDKSPDGMPLSARLGLGLLIILVVAVVVRKYWAKIIAIKDFFFK